MFHLKQWRITVFFLILCVGSPIWSQTHIGDGFAYQGYLTEGELPANGDYDLVFNLYDGEDPATAVLIGSIDLPGAAVVDGVFNVTLDFGALDGHAYWLEVQVRPMDEGLYTSLSPLQPLESVPYALHANRAATADDAETLDGLDSSAFLPADRAHVLSASDGSPGDAVYVDEDGFMGVGTINPERLLHVGQAIPNESEFLIGQNSLSMRGVYGSDRLPYLEVRDQSLDRAFYLGWGSETNKQIDWTFENGYDLLIAGGKVGIGVNDPDHLLTVGGSTHIDSMDPRIQLSDTSVPAGDPGASWTLGNQDALFKIYPDALDADPSLAINATGQVSIGTLAPLARLHVSSTESGAIIQQNAELGGISNYFEPQFPTLSVKRASSTRGASLALGNQNGKFYLYGNHSIFRIISETDEPLLSMWQDGRFGLGSDRPNSNFVVTNNGWDGDLNWAAAIDSKTSDDTTAALHVRNASAYSILFAQSDGHVGFGTDRPSAAIDIADSLSIGQEVNFPAEGSIPEGAWGAYILGNNGDGRTLRLGVSNDNSTRAEIELENNNESWGQILFKTRSSGLGVVERMRITSAGRVGIGLTDPTEKLSVKGVVESTQGGIKFPDGTIQTTAATPVSTKDGATPIYGDAEHTGSMIIDEPGSYRLIENLHMTDPNQPAIRIEVDNVTLDLDGFGIYGPGYGVGDGIWSPHANIIVKNGTIEGMGGNGLTLGSAAHVEGVMSADNGGDGIVVGARSLVLRNRIQGNGAQGATAGAGSILEENIVFDNARMGIVTGRGCGIRNNTTQENGHDGIHAGEGCRIEGNLIFENRGNGVTSAQACSLKGNTVGMNAGYGLNMAGGTWLNNMLYENNGDKAQIFLGGPMISLGDNICGDGDCR